VRSRAWIWDFSSQHSTTAPSGGSRYRRRGRRRASIGVSLVNIAVLGAGGGGLAVAHEWASRGHRVSLYAQRAHDHHLAPVRERGGIQAEGLLEGFVRLETVTSDIAEALEGVEVIFVVGPAYATESFAADTRGHLHPGMCVVVCPSSCVGSLAFKRAPELDLYDERWWGGWGSNPRPTDYETSRQRQLRLPPAATVTAEPSSAAPRTLVGHSSHHV
jgi:hypothetical protein